MADDSSQEKTEQATPQQLKKARERGQVAISRDLSSAVLLAVALLLTASLLPQAARGFVDDVRQAWTLACAPHPGHGSLDGQLGPVLGHFFAGAAGLIAPPLALLAAAGALVGFVQAGPVLSGTPLKLQLSRLNPLAGLKRMFAS